jgi:hypothetical protein
MGVSMSRTSTGGDAPSATTRSAESLGSSEGGAGTVVGSSEQIELASLEEEGVERGMGIRKTVKIEVSVSSGAGQGEPRRPQKAYFPDDSEGSFLDLS